MNADLSLVRLVADASFVVQIVMLSLLVISIVSWSLIFRKKAALGRAHSQALEFENTFWSGTDLSTLYSRVDREETNGLQAIFAAGFREFLRSRPQTRRDPELMVDSARRAMLVALGREVDDLETHLNFLATAGSTSPYIGLFGTVWGIMNSFRALGDVQYATLQLVAPGIAEALIATAMGLFAAIPAVIAYNRYSYQLDRLTGRYETFVDEFTNILQRQMPAINRAEAPSGEDTGPDHA